MTPPSPTHTIFCYNPTMKRLLPVLMVFGVFLGSAGESSASTGDNLRNNISGNWCERTGSTGHMTMRILSPDALQLCWNGKCFKHALTIESENKFTLKHSGMNGYYQVFSGGQ